VMRGAYKTRFLVENCAQGRTNRLLRLAGFFALFNGANYLGGVRSDASFLREIRHVMLQRFAVYIELGLSNQELVVSEENKIRDVIDAVTGVAKAVPVYQDVVQPAAQEMGKALQTVAKTVHIALAPVSALVWGYDQIKEFVATKVSERLKNVPPENIISPKPNVAGPALEALRYTGHEERLSDMYANLLAASMDKSTAQGAHPAFVEIIRQLTPDEAKLVSLFLKEMPFPLLNVRWEYKTPTEEKKGGLDVLVNFSQLGEAAGCEFIHLVPAYIDNLCRLGLADIPAMFI
jgi:Abortive infection alpha